MHIGSWRTLQGLGVALAFGALTACAGDSDKMTDTTAAVMADKDAMGTGTAMGDKMTGRWTTSLTSMSGTNVTGTASAMPGTTANTTMAEVTIAGAPANGTHPWHIHAGTCASGGDIVGPAADYPPLTADANGAATSTATINVAPPTSGDYHVNVHLSPSDLGTIVACGDLRMDAM